MGTPPPSPRSTRDDIDRMAGGSFASLRESYVAREVANLDTELSVLLRDEPPVAEAGTE